MLERRHPSALHLLQTAASCVVSLIIYILVVIRPIINADLFADESAADQIILEIVSSAMALVPILLILVLTFVAEWIKWANTWISAKDNVLTYESGLLSKKVKTIPFSKINTINLNRTLMQRIFGTCRMKIDTGALAGEAGGTSEMNLVFKVSEAEELRAYILNSSAKEEQLLRQAAQSPMLKKAAYTPLKSSDESKWTVKAKFADFFMYGLTSSGWWMIVTLFCFVIGFVGEFTADELGEMLEVVAPQLDAVQSMTITSAVLVLVLIAIAGIVGLELFAKIITIITSSIKYFGFKATREADSLIISYGLTSQKSYTIPVRNVHAIVVRQNLLQQLMKRCSVELVAIGYGTHDEEQENDSSSGDTKAMLYPLIKTEQLPWLIEKLLPEYSVDAELKGADKRAIGFHIVRPMVCWALVFAAAILCVIGNAELLTIGIVAAVIALLLMLPGKILRHRNSAIGWNDEVVVVSSGGMRKSTHYIRTDAVQSLHTRSGIFQRRRGLATYSVRFHAPAGRSVAAATNLDKAHFEPLADVVESVM